MRPIRNVDLQLRFVDTDMLGHVNNAVFATYAELGRVQFFRDLGIEARTFILARLAIDYRRQVLLSDACRITTEPTRVGRSSIHMRQVLYANDQVAAEIEAVIVWFDYEKQEPAAVPPEVRALLGMPPEV